MGFDQLLSSEKYFLITGKTSGLLVSCIKSDFWNNQKSSTRLNVLSDLAEITFWKSKKWFMFPDCIDVTLILISFVFIYGEVFS